eukprot:XP_011668335.1 PREDICTED: uncharacterized protein LOC105440172 [Strongylocentrotus purpuratus]
MVENTCDVFQLSHFTDTPASPQGDIKVTLTQLATPVVLQFATAEKKTYSISLDVETGSESSTISLSRFNILVKSQNVNGLHLDGQLVDIRIVDQKVQIILEGSAIFEYEDTAQPPNAGAKCLIQNAQVQYSFTSTGSGSSNPEGSGSSAGFDPSKFPLENFFNVPEHLKGKYIGLTLSGATFPAYIEFANDNGVRRYLFTFLEGGIITLQVSYEEVQKSTVPDLTLNNQNIFFKIADGQVKVAFLQTSNDVLTYQDDNQPANSDTQMLVVNFGNIAFVSSTGSGSSGISDTSSHPEGSGSSAGFDPSKFPLENFFNVPEHLKGKYIGLTLSGATFPAYIEFANDNGVRRYLFTFLEGGIITLQVSYEEVQKSTVPDLTLNNQNIFFKIADGQVKVAFLQTSNDVLTYQDDNQPANSDTQMLVVNFGNIAFVSSTGSGSSNPEGSAIFPLENFFDVPEYLKGNYIGLTLSGATFPAYIEFANDNGVRRYLFTFLEGGIITLQVSYEEVQRATVPDLTLTNQNIFFKIADGQVKVAFLQTSNDVLTYQDDNQPANSDTQMLVANFAAIALVSRYDI